MILGDSITIAEHAARDGVACSLIVEPEMMHVWPIVADRQEQSRSALDQIAAWLRGAKT
jgi:acetyl esterase/lipase